MRRRSPRPLAPPHLSGPPANPSTPFVYGAGHRATRETVQGREYYETGGVSREWVATRERLELDERLLPPAVRRGPSRFLRRLRQFAMNLAICAAAVALAVACTWAGWILGGAEGAVVGMAIVALLYASAATESSGS